MNAHYADACMCTHMHALGNLIIVSYVYAEIYINEFRINMNIYIYIYIYI